MYIYLLELVTKLVALNIIIIYKLQYAQSMFLQINITNINTNSNALSHVYSLNKTRRHVNT